MTVDVFLEHPTTDIKETAWLISRGAELLRLERCRLPESAPIRSAPRYRFVVRVPERELFAWQTDPEAVKFRRALAALDQLHDTLRTAAASSS